MSLPFAFLDQRPIVIAIAGSNGAGRSTFFESFLLDCGLRFINADVIAEEWNHGTEKVNLGPLAGKRRKMFSQGKIHSRTSARLGV